MKKLGAWGLRILIEEEGGLGPVASSPTCVRLPFIPEFYSSCAVKALAASCAAIEVSVASQLVSERALLAVGS